MSFTYTPMSSHEAESARFNLLKEGEYDAVTVKMTPKISKSGNSMIESSITVYDNDGNSHFIYDYLVFMPSMMWKCIHFCEAAGLSNEYASGSFTPEMGENKNIRVRIGVRQGGEIPVDKLNGKPIGSKYPDKNVIEDYLKKGEWKVNAVEPPFNDDLPF